jgi:hypothetical protein
MITENISGPFFLEKKKLKWYTGLAFVTLALLVWTCLSLPWPVLYANGLRANNGLLSPALLEYSGANFPPSTNYSNFLPLIH